MTNDDIQVRLENSLSSIDSRTRTEFLHCKKLSETLSSRQKEPVLISVHIGALGHLLGLESTCTRTSNVFKQAHTLYRKHFSKPLEPYKAIQDTFLTSTYKSKRLKAYTRKDVEASFKTLDEQFQLEYTPERFDYAVTELFTIF